jgi:hypothetical protein
MSQTANDLIMGSGAPSAKFPTVGTKYVGEVVATDTGQQRDFKSGELKFWPDCNPMMQAIITLQTDDRDPEITDDDGRRRLFVSSRNMREAIKDAIVKAGARIIEPGGKLAVQYTGDGEAQGAGNPPKLYVAQYKRPEPQAVSASDLIDDSEPF